MFAKDKRASLSHLGKVYRMVQVPSEKETNIELKKTKLKIALGAEKPSLVVIHVQAK
jgi:hypothetical protein